MNQINNREISVSISDVSKQSWKFGGLLELTEFIRAEAEFWATQRQRLSSLTAKQLHPYIAQTNLDLATKTIDGWAGSLADWDDALFSQNFGAVQSILNSLPSCWIWSGQAFTMPFVECNLRHGKNSATAFIDLVLQKSFRLLDNKEVFFGSLLAYEFLNQDSDFIKRSEGEKAAIDQLKDQLEKTTNSLISDVDAFKSGFSGWNEKKQKEWVSLVDLSGKQLEALKNDSQRDLTDFLVNGKKMISELESVYQEKLRLEKPAKYWNKASTRYGRQGGLWMIALLLFVIFGLEYFSKFYSAWLKGQSTGVQLSTIQGIIIFGTLVTIYAFAVRAISRLAFSAFHLMRDAEEREQLTYLFLSLSNGSQIDASSRDIVLQSLFSRSETGLLSKESGPTMPGVADLVTTAARMK